MNMAVQIKYCPSSGLFCLLGFFFPCSTLCSDCNHFNVSVFVSFLSLFSALLKSELHNNWVFQFFIFILCVYKSIFLHVCASRVYNAQEIYNAKRFKGTRSPETGVTNDS